MKVLVTGATGFLGRHIVKKFADEGAEMVTVIRPTSKTDHLKKYPIEFILGDVQNEESLKKAMKGVDVVVHAAADIVGSWDDFHGANVQSTKWLLEMSLKNKVKRFVFISTIDVYDHAKARNGTVLTEESPKDPKPSNFYSQAKIEAENWVEEYYQKYNLPTVILRPGCIFGIGGNWYPARLGFDLGINKYAILGNGGSAIPMSHASSVVDLIWRSIQDDKAIGKAYNILEETKVTRFGFLKSAKAILFPKLKIYRIPIWLSRLMAFGGRLFLKMIGQQVPTRIQPEVLRLFSISVYYSSELAKQELGWQPVADVPGAVEDMLRWHRAPLDIPRSEMLIPKEPVPVPQNKKVQVGIVGCGMITENHFLVLKRLPQIEVTAVCDPNLDNANSVAKKYKVPKVYSSLKEMLENEKPDAVHINSPTQTHAELAILAMKNGCHVLVEKPFSADAKEAREMMKVAEKEGVICCVEHPLLYHPAMIQVRQWIQDGIIGDIMQVEAWFGTDFSNNIGVPFLRYNAKDSWIYQLPGALFQDFMPHPLCLVMDVMGEVTDVTVRSKYNKLVPHMKTDELRLILENEKTIGTLSLSFGASPRHIFFNVFGNKNTAKVDFLNGTAILYDEAAMMPKAVSRGLLGLKHGKIMRKVGRKNIRTAFSPKQILSQGYDTLFRLFYRSILLEEPNPVPIQHSVKTMEVMDKVWSQVTIR